MHSIIIFSKKKAISEFHDALTKFINQSADGKPLVIFVDELDRCRPNYAIELLERIKHLFNTEGLVFVLALDKKQLGHSIQAVYGNGIDSNGYLRRFIDFEYQLKEPDKANYINSLFSSLQLDKFFEPRNQYPELQYDQAHLKNVFAMLATGLQLSLREIEQLLASINIVVRTAKENEYIFPALLVFLVISKHFNSYAYQRYVSDEGEESELIDYLYKIVPSKNRIDSFECALIEGFLIAAKNDRLQKVESPIVLKHKEILKNAQLDFKERNYSEMVLNVVSRPTARGSINLKRLKDRIDWLSRFEFSNVAD